MAAMRADAMPAQSVPFQIPGYRILRRIGIGGMASVYLASQESLARLVAIKVLASQQTPSEELVRRFENEARTIARLDHPHIVSIFDVGRTSTGQIYYTMPYLPNGDLAGRTLRDDPARVLEVVRALAEALGCAHDQGIVHRDVKPENVLFDKLDRPLLADFGIALSGGNQPRVTREGATIGSSGYMSPEQARGQPLDGRSDFYSLGVVCYELLTGEMPFRGSDALSVALAHIEKPVPRLPVTRRAWQPLIDKALAKQPDARFQSAEELLAAIDVVGKRMQAPPRRGLARLWLPALERTVAIPRQQRALALLAILLGVLAGLLALLPQVPERAALPAPAATQPAAPAPAAPATAPATAPTAEALAMGPETWADQRTRLLQEARDLLAVGRMTLPAGNNASESYLAVLQQEPDQADALQGLAQVLSLLGARAAKAIDEGTPDAAAGPLASGLKLAERAGMQAGDAFDGFADPVRSAAKRLLQQPHGPFEPGAAAALQPLQPLLARLDADLGRDVQAAIDGPADLLHKGGVFHDANGPSMVVVTAERARMGRVDQPFAVAARLVTRADYARFASATGRADARCRESRRLFARSDRLGWRSPGFSQGDDHPVVCVSWDDAAAYAHWLGERTGARYRLPTTVEWQLAARAAGAGTGCRAGNIGGRAAAKPADCNDAFEHTSPVAHYPATTPGVYDIAGNVSEWVGGCAGSARGGACGARTFRGLSWRDEDDASNLLRHETVDGDIGYPDVGFRVVRELPESAAAAVPATTGAEAGAGPGPAR
jgi:formylglycine-generating enzyme required for sulfatase activity